MNIHFFYLIPLMVILSMGAYFFLKGQSRSLPLRDDVAKDTTAKSPLASHFREGAKTSED